MIHTDIFLKNNAIRQTILGKRTENFLIGLGLFSYELIFSRRKEYLYMLIFLEIHLHNVIFFENCDILLSDNKIHLLHVTFSSKNAA